MAGAQGPDPVEDGPSAALSGDLAVHHDQVVAPMVERVWKISSITKSSTGSM